MGEALKKSVLGLAEIQLEGAAELLGFYIDRFEPFPEGDEEPLTELHESYLRVHRGYEAITRRMEKDRA